MPPTHTTEGLDAARAIRMEFPDTAIVVLSAHVELDQATDLNGRGERSGYLLKSRVTDVDDFVDTLDRIVDGMGRASDLEMLMELEKTMGIMPGTTICGLAAGKTIRRSQPSPRI